VGSEKVTTGGTVPVIVPTRVQFIPKKSHT
jgi:hypothetical protein